jgi:predicted RNA-binding Zn ribbon-like protein
MPTPPPPSTTYELTGGHPALDFVNTVGGNRLVNPKEHLPRFGDLVAWATDTHVLTPAEAKALVREAVAHPDDAERALVHARTFRESLYRVLLALVEARPAPAADVVALEEEVHRALAARRLESKEGRFSWTSPGVCLLETVVPRLALAASELLTSDSLSRVHVCEATVSDGCGWLFLDETRNHSRRWCSMATCGNQHKARRHYARVRGRN